jgi:tRNA uridine 5-carboxymethylaminomethyl modification enzyme
LIYESGRVAGCRTNLDIDFHGRAVVVTTGTFLQALMHIGTNKTEGGRMGDYSAKTLSASLREAGIQLERLKTGTPPRLLGRSIDGDYRSSGNSARPLLYDIEEEICSTWNTRPKRLRQPGERQVSWLITHTSPESQRL